MKVLFCLAVLLVVASAQYSSYSRGDGGFGCFDGFCRPCNRPRTECNQGTGRWRAEEGCRRSCGWGCFYGVCRHCRYNDCTDMRVFSSWMACWDRRCSPNALFPSDTSTK